MSKPNHSTQVNILRKHRDELFIALQRLLPQHSLSRLLGKVADSKNQRLKNLLIRMAIQRFKIDLSEADSTDPESYQSFNHFFTRRLKDSVRPIDRRPNALVSPADGAISELGRINQGTIFQAKNHQYSTQALLACSASNADVFNNGSFVTIYLSPKDYHRVHMPVDGKLIRTDYIPGKLFSVNGTTVRQVDGLFARNERLVCWFDTELGKVAVVLVGALLVAGIETPWQQHFIAGEQQTRAFEPSTFLAKGTETGVFKFGSTVVVLTENRVDWHSQQIAGAPCQMGEALGEFV